MNHAILLADAESIIKIILVIIFFVVPTISQLLSSKQAPKKDDSPAQPRNAPKRPSSPARSPTLQQTNPPTLSRQELEEEIKTFKQGGGRTLPNALDRASSATTPPMSSTRPTMAQGSRIGAPKKTGTSKPSKTKRLSQSIGDRTREHLDTRAMQEHARNLGREVDQADERVDAHLHKVFDHQIGQLSSDGGRLTTERLSIEEGARSGNFEEAQHKQFRGRERAQELRKSVQLLLSTPQGLQQAFIVNEILGPPRADQM